MLAVEAKITPDCADLYSFKTRTKLCCLLEGLLVPPMKLEIMLQKGTRATGLTSPHCEEDSRKGQLYNRTYRRTESRCIHILTKIATLSKRLVAIMYCGRLQNRYLNFKVPPAQKMLKVLYYQR